MQTFDIGGVAAAAAAQVTHKDVYKRQAVVCVTRNADISPEDEGYEIDSDYRHHMKRILKKRERLAPVRLETQGDGDGAIASYLCDKLHIRKDQVFRSKSPLDLSYVYTLESKLPASSVRSLVYPPFQPQPPASVSPDESLLRRVERQDLLLSFPCLLYTSILEHIPSGFLDLIAGKNHVYPVIDRILHLNGQNSRVPVQILGLALKTIESVCVLQVQCGDTSHLLFLL